MDTWNGTAKLRWFVEGDKVGEECFAFVVECSELPQDDRLRPDNMRRLVTLQLVCAEAESRYSVPPRVVDIETGAERDDDAVIPLAARARWRMASGGFCHSIGIKQIGPPPPGARLVDLRVDSSSNA